jgi:hypothetical protein
LLHHSSGGIKQSDITQGGYKELYQGKFRILSPNRVKSVIQKFHSGEKKIAHFLGQNCPV